MYVDKYKILIYRFSKNFLITLKNEMSILIGKDT
jgi:hypothetical protein